MQRYEPKFAMLREISLSILQDTASAAHPSISQLLLMSNLIGWPVSDRADGYRHWA
jgi:hypothetical protein